MKQVFTGNPGQAVRQLSDLGDAITRTVSDATGKTIMMFAALVRSTKDLTRFLLLFRISKEACAVPVAANAVSTANNG